jgi:hypothetical protein
VHQRFQRGGSQLAEGLVGGREERVRALAAELCVELGDAERVGECGEVACLERRFDDAALDGIHVTYKTRLNRFHWHPACA